MPSPKKIKKPRRQSKKAVGTTSLSKNPLDSDSLQKPVKETPSPSKLQAISKEKRKNLNGASTPTDFPIVGIGASAGGLEAFREFFTGLPPDIGAAFVLVPHQSPGHISLLSGLLQKCTTMPVREVSDGMAVKPDTVYLALAGKNLAMVNGTLHVMEPNQESRLPLPIDFFLRSLAEDQKHRAIGIILSGTGSDGTLGLKAIKGELGMTMAQEPQSAKYDGMPQSAIAAGNVDFVCPPSGMPGQIQAYIRRFYLAPAPSYPETESDLGQVLQKIFVLLRERTGNEFSLYKPNTIRRRIERRMNVHQIESPNQYLRYLLENSHEVDALFQEILIGVTSFFRDPAGFEVLANLGLSGLLKTKSREEPVRVWVPGCGTGEEAYSLAILLHELMTQRKSHVRILIFGTDLDGKAIEIARKGIYPAGIAHDVTPTRLQQFFTKEDSHFRVKKVIRDLVIFAPHNLLADPPYTKLDLISCRNLLIYLESRAQRRLFPLFHHALKPDGLLFLGSSEAIGEGEGGLFETIDRKWKLYRRNAGVTNRYSLEGFPIRGVQVGREVSTGEERAVHGSAPPSIPNLIESLLLEQYAPPSVIINERGEIVYIHGRTGAYLEPAPGQPNLILVNMAREGLRNDLMTALHELTFQKKEVVCRGIRIKTNGAVVSVDLTAKRIEDPEPLRGLYQVTFESRPTGSSLPKKESKKSGGKQEAASSPAVVQELHYTKQRLQRSIEELQTSNEELKSTNEELQSTNEELQSTNEELEMSKEELQSLNEELVTVNAECQGKIEELSAANDDLHNLLNSTELATVFLDNNLNIKGFTPEAKRVINLIATDVGRPLVDIVSKLPDDRLIQDAQEVLRTLVSQESEVQTTDGKWYALRIFPYRTAKNTIDGVVVTLLNISGIKEAEMAAREAQEYAESIIQTVREPLIVLDGELQVVTANQSFYRIFHLSPSKVERQLFYSIGEGEWNIPELRQLLEEVLPQSSSFQNFEVDHTFARSGRRVFVLNARRLERKSGKLGLILLALEDMTQEHIHRDAPVSGHDEKEHE